MEIFKEEWLSFYLLFGHTYSMQSNQLFLVFWNYSERTFCCCRNSCIAHTCLIFHFSIKLLFSLGTYHLLPGFRYPEFQATKHVKVLGERCVWKPSLSHPSGCEQLSLAAPLTGSGNLRQKGAFSTVNPQSMFVWGFAIIALQLNWLHLPLKSMACKRSRKNHCVALRI